MSNTVTVNQIFRGKQASQYFGAEGTYLESTAIDPDLPIISTDTRTSGFPVPVGSAKFSSTDVTSAVIREITHQKDNNLWTVQTNGKINVYNAALTTETIIGTVTGSNATWAEYYKNYIYIFGTGSAFDDVSRVGPLNTLPFDGQTGNFTVGLTVTGGTSGATGIVISQVDAGATGTLTLSNITGLFVDNEAITDTSTGAAVVNRTFASLITNSWWKGTLSLTALSNTKYPTLKGVVMPNHVATVHGDDSLYFCDFSGGQGLIHRIHTKTVTNEGDTDDSTVPSGYNALDLPFGFYPTALAQFGTLLMVLGIYTVDTTTNQGKSAFVLWNTTDTVSFSTGPIFISDPLATALLNVNGVVYLWSGNAQNGVRLSYYNGGESVTEAVFQEEGVPPLAGAVDALGNRIVWGGSQTSPSTCACVWAWGSKDARLPVGLHNVMRHSGSGTTPTISALRYVQQDSNVTPKTVISWKDSGGQGIDKYSTTATLAAKIRWLMNVGVRHDIRKISIPIAGAISSGVTIVPTVYMDDASSNQALATINNSSYPSKRKVIYKGTECKNLTAQNNFILEISYTGTVPTPVGLPIITVIDVREDEPV